MREAAQNQPVLELNDKLKNLQDFGEMAREQATGFKENLASAHAEGRNQRTLDFIYSEAKKWLLARLIANLLINNPELLDKENIDSEILAEAQRLEFGSLSPENSIFNQALTEVKKAVDPEAYSHESRQRTEELLSRTRRSLSNGRDHPELDDQLSKRERIQLVLEDPQSTDPILAISSYLDQAIDERRAYTLDETIAFASSLTGLSREHIIATIGERMISSLRTIDHNGFNIIQNRPETGDHLFSISFKNFAPEGAPIKPGDGSFNFGEIEIRLNESGEVEYEFSKCYS